MDSEDHVFMWEYIFWGLALIFLFLVPIIFDFHWFFHALFWGLGGIVFLKRTLRVGRTVVDIIRETRNNRRNKQ